MVFVFLSPQEYKPRESSEGIYCVHFYIPNVQARAQDVEYAQ